MLAPLTSVFVLFVPLWIALLFLGRSGHRRRALRVLAAGAFVGFVGSICFIELRRYGLLGAAMGGMETRLEDLARFVLVGSTAAWIVDLLDARFAPEPPGPEHEGKPE